MAANIICRALDSNGDWTFGAGKNNYVANQLEIAQDISMNLKMFLGDCFFATNIGIDWLNLLGTIGPRAQLNLNLAINAAILNTTGVTGIKQTSLSINPNRGMTIQYVVTTAFSVLSSSVTFDVGTLG